MKFLKRLMSKRNNAGFTLVEVVISVGLLGILLLGMTIFVGPILQAAADTKGDIRASILAETVNAYISRSLMNAQYVAVFEGITSVRDSDKNDSDHKADLDKVYANSALMPLKTYMEKDNNSNLYEVRCISITRKADDRTNQIKWMVNLNKVKKGVDSQIYYIEDSNPVFDDCFYDDLYPQIIVEQAMKDASSKAAALKLTINIYSDQEMQSVSMIGDGFAQLINVPSNKVDNYVSFTKIDPTTTKEHTDIYIFYVARKTF
ncbi:MAG: prepilin-type N-terminal cleavage/methylation domain-containing protein [Oscillospiraceae bacterium]|nr:prepilin-type N-terminal cleavage/methylation domain-containing protein [Oscillospiraceae bacterium]